MVFPDNTYYESPSFSKSATAEFGVDQGTRPIRKSQPIIICVIWAMILAGLGLILDR